MSGGKHYSSSVVLPPAVLPKLPPPVTKGATLSATALVGVLGDTVTIAAAVAAAVAVAVAAVATGEGVAVVATAAA